MLQLVLNPSHPNARALRSPQTGQRSAEPLEARVKRECAELYPGVDPRIWYQVVLDGEYQDDLEGFWIQLLYAEKTAAKNRLVHLNMQHLPLRYWQTLAPIATCTATVYSRKSASF